MNQITFDLCLKSLLKLDENILTQGDVGDLNVKFEWVGGSTVLWNRKGTQGNEWRRGQYNLVSYVDYKVIFEGVLGKGAKGDM